MEVKGVVVVEDVAAPADAPGSRLPTALEHVANRPIAHHVLDALEAAGVGDVVVASSELRAGPVRECLERRLRRAGGTLRYVEQRGPMDLGDALRLAAPLVGGAPCIVHVASGLLGEPLEPVIERVRHASPDVILTVHQGSIPVRHLSPATQELLHIAELDPERAALSMGGVCAFGPGALLYASTASWRAGRDTDLTAVAKLIATAGGAIEVLAVNAWSQYAGDPADLLELNRIALDRLDAGLRRPNDNGNRIEGRVQIHRNASVVSSVIVGPTVVGPGARIADAYIGPYTSIGAGACIEGAEIERSIISPGASIMHVGGRMVSSVVGRDARVFRDFSLPRALRLSVGDGTVVALC
jgi:glucose-1-phosphate thymidylyltransferase